MVTGPLMVFLAAAGGSILSLLHQAPSGVSVAIPVLAAAFLVDALTGPVGHVLTMSGRSWLNLVNNAAAVAANVGLNLILIPRFGIAGAAISWAVVIIVVNAARVLEVRALVGILPFGPGSLRPLLALLPAAVGAIAVGRWLVAGGSAPIVVMAIVAAVVAVLYAATLAVTGVPEDDRVFLRSLVWRRRIPAVVEAGS
jgi:O-antigen/teichoic acid export membrane protein